MKRLVMLVLVASMAAGMSHAAPGTSAAGSKTQASSGAVKSAKAPAAPTRAPAGPRKLEDIHIEGEIPVPQVLFITARDQRRFLDFHHRRYLRTSRELGEATTLPSRIVILPASTSAETSR